jgi:hypothetical protein
MKKFILALSLLAFTLVAPWSVLAQTQPEISATAEAILQKQRLDEEIASLNQIYRGQLTEYNQAERNFQIARDQYLELQTLASINAVTESARKVMRLRNQVLLTYFELLRVKLVAAEGVELSLKTAVMPKLETQKNWLQQQQGQLAAANDRQEFNSLADEFTGRTRTFQSVAEEVGSLLAVGKLQNVFDRLAAIGTDITANQASDSAVTVSRAMRETERATAEARVSLQTTWSSLRGDIQDDNVNNFYGDISETLEPIYSSLNQLAAFLAELLKVQ